MSLNTEFAQAFDIPVFSIKQKIWFFRTKAGSFYADFTVNNYIALGWDLISPDLIRDPNSGKETKIERIANLYDEEKRPGLIFGQMDTFYNRMTEGDLVVIPSHGGREIQIGIIREFIKDVVHRAIGDDYPHCTFKHKRRVEWIKKVDTEQDIYLFKALRAQQTISNITDQAALVLRNLFPVYISGEEIHITLQKETKSEYNLSSNVDLFANLLTAIDQTAALYGRLSIREQITIKTAVGSPGFIETILPKIPVAIIAIGTLVKVLIGKTKDSDGVTETGILAIIGKINSLINDHHTRKKTDAEIELIAAQAKVENANALLIEAQAKSEIAEAKMKEAQTRKLLAEAREIELRNSKYEQVQLLQSGQTSVEFESEQELLTISTGDAFATTANALVQSLENVASAAADGGLSFDGKKIEKAS